MNEEKVTSNKQKVKSKEQPAKSLASFFRYLDLLLTKKNCIKTYYNTLLSGC